LNAKVVKILMTNQWSVTTHLFRHSDIRQSGLILVSGFVIRVLL